MTATNESRGESFIRFADEAPPLPAAPAKEPWKVLIVDDDDQIHLITRMVLADLSVDERRPHFLSAFSGEEARRVLGQHDDIAVIFLDVVMESDQAGLLLARHIREDLGNERVRIILRTGQPGQAPERAIIDHYDINDYRAKSELTAEKLYTAAATALRSFRDIQEVDDRRRGFERIIATSTRLYNKRTLAEFVAALSPEFQSLIPGLTGLLFCTDGADGIRVIAAEGDLAAPPGQPLASCLTESRRQDIHRVLRGQNNLFDRDHCVILLPSRTGAHRVAYVTGYPQPKAVSRSLLELFCGKVATGFDNAYLNEQVLAAQRATVYALGKLAEYKDGGGSAQVLRIGTLARRTAQWMKDRGVHGDLIDDTFFEKIELAGVLHDIGKVAIPDRILQKPGPLDAEESAWMQRHVIVGATLLREAAALVDRPTYLSMGAEVAQHHHERFDGSGYPQGLAGGEIPLAAQIVAIADVYDALIREWHYKPAWSHQQAVAWIRAESGRHFAPEIVEAFLGAVGAGDVAP